MHTFFYNHSNVYFCSAFFFFGHFFFCCPQIDSSVSTNTSHSAFTGVFTTFTTLITDTALPLNLKVIIYCKPRILLHVCNVHVEV